VCQYKITSFAGCLQQNTKKLKFERQHVLAKQWQSYHLTSAFGLPNTTSHSSFTDFPEFTLTLLRLANTAGSLPAANSTQILVHTTRKLSIFKID